MLSQAQRTAILELSAKGVSKHEIAQVLRLSRLSVRKVLALQLHQRASDPTGGESGTVPRTDPRTLDLVQGKSRASP